MAERVYFSAGYCNECRRDSKCPIVDFVDFVDRTDGELTIDDVASAARRSNKVAGSSQDPYPCETPPMDFVDESDNRDGRLYFVSCPNSTEDDLASGILVFQANPVT